jgi:protein ImuB
MEPIATPEAFAQVIGDLVADVVGQLTCIGKGARRLDCYFHRVDGHNQAIRIGTATASRDAGHLAKLLCAKIETVEPGLGIEAMTLVTPLADALAAQQDEGWKARDAGRTSPLWSMRSPTVLVHGACIGRHRTRAVCLSARSPRCPPLRRIAAPSGTMTSSPRPHVGSTRANRRGRPAARRSPRLFVWRRKRYRVTRGDGPERLHGEWWRESGNEADKALIVGIIIRSRPRQAVGTGCSGSVTA